MHKRTQYVALFWGLHCDSDACDFSAIIGWTHELPRDIRLGFCSNCFKRVHVQEICDPNDLDFIVDTRVMRVLIPVSKPVLGLTPRARRLRRKELGLPPKGRSVASSAELFEQTGTHLFYEHLGGPVAGVTQAECPYCQADGAIVIGFDEEDPQCPKCRTGTVRSDYGSGW